MTRHQRIGLLGRAASLALCLAAGCGGDPGEASASAEPTVTQRVEIVDVAGIDAVLAQHRGRGVLLNFWAIWCAPCVAELPELVETAHEFRERGGDVVLVSYDLMLPNQEREAVREKVARFATERGIDLPILVYDALDYEAIDTHFELQGGVPVTLAFDREGKLVDREDQQTNKARFVEMMEKAIGR
jgi:thiol-disulfide isomerase/thioredoxin